MINLKPRTSALIGCLLIAIALVFVAGMRVAGQLSEAKQDQFEYGIMAPVGGTYDEKCEKLGGLIINIGYNRHPEDRIHFKHCVSADSQDTSEKLTNTIHTLSWSLMPPHRMTGEEMQEWQEDTLAMLSSPTFGG